MNNHSGFSEIRGIRKNKTVHFFQFGRPCLTVSPQPGSDLHRPFENEQSMIGPPPRTLQSLAQIFEKDDVKVEYFREVPTRMRMCSPANRRFYTVVSVTLEDDEEVKARLDERINAIKQLALPNVLAYQRDFYCQIVSPAPLTDSSTSNGGSSLKSRRTFPCPTTSGRARSSRRTSCSFSPTTS